MKKLLFLTTALVLTASTTQAQPWLKNFEPGKPIQLQEVIDAYEREHANDAKEEYEEYEGGKIVKENKDYHFSRWVWYWERHLDENGYLVSPIQNWLEANAFEKGKTADKTTAVDLSQWSFQGPHYSGSGYNGIGRINVVAFHPTDSNTFWIGSAGGGAWKTTDGGLNWSIISNYLPVLGVADIDFNPLNPNTVYMCTGDRDGTDNYSVGVLKSTDGGATWDTTGMVWETKETKQTNCLEINPLDTNSLTLATNVGIYKSYDGGGTWIFTTGGNYKQVVYHPQDTSILYAASTDNIARSTNGGASWQLATSFLSNVSRIVIAVSPASPHMVKAVVANSSNGLEGIYRSADTGKTFAKIFSDGTNCSTNILASSPSGNACGGQGWYDLSMAISPLDTNEMVVGGVNTWYSGDGGYSWVLANKWSGGGPSGVKVVHADKHYHAYNPIAPTTLYECNDGGIYKTNAPNSTLWTDISNGLGITQFYRNAVANNTSFVLGGAQDNGTKKIVNATTNTQQTGADGMDCQIDFTNANTYYTSQQYGELRRTYNNGGAFTDISNKIPGGQPTGAWITPLVIRPHLSNELLAGYQYVYASSDKGDSWTAISPKFLANISRIAVAMTNPDHIYILVSNRIWHTPDNGDNWSMLPIQPAGNVSDIHVDPKNEDHLWITYSGYNANKAAEYSPEWKWTVRNEQLPNVPVNCITIDSLNGTIYIGTDIGVYYRDHNVIEWVKFNNNLPVVEVTDLGINYTSNEIWAATYGRGMWKSAVHDPSKTTAVGNIPLAMNVVSLAPNPNNGHFEIRTDNKALQEQVVKIRIMGMNGAVAWQNDVRVNAQGTASIQADLPRGSYVVEINKDALLFAKEKIVVY